MSCVVGRVAHDSWRAWEVAAVAIAAGLALGAVDLLAQRTLPYPWANLANSPAVWAVAAFGIGRRVRGGWWRPALAGVVLLIVAVESYYLSATLVQHDDVANLWSATTLTWLAFGVVAGLVFGPAGAWSVGPHRWPRRAGIAAPGAVLLAEAALLTYRAGGDAAYRADSLRTAAIEAALGIGVTLVLVVRGWMLAGVPVQGARTDAARPTSGFVNRHAPGRVRPGGR